jgi:hypothetical protein
MEKGQEVSFIKLLTLVPEGLPQLAVNHIS